MPTCCACGEFYTRVCPWCSPNPISPSSEEVTAAREQQISDQQAREIFERARHTEWRAKNRDKAWGPSGDPFHL